MIETYGKKQKIASSPPSSFVQIIDNLQKLSSNLDTTTINSELNTWISGVKAGIRPGLYLFDRTHILKKDNNNTTLENIKIGETDEDLENIKKKEEDLPDSKNTEDRDWDPDNPDDDSAANFIGGYTKNNVIKIAGELVPVSE